MQGRMGRDWGRLEGSGQCRAGRVGAGRAGPGRPRAGRGRAGRGMGGAGQGRAYQGTVVHTALERVPDRAGQAAEEVQGRAKQGRAGWRGQGSARAGQRRVRQAEAGLGRAGQSIPGQPGPHSPWRVAGLNAPPWHRSLGNICRGRHAAHGQAARPTTGSRLQHMPSDLPTPLKTCNTFNIMRMLSTY